MNVKPMIGGAVFGLFGLYMLKNALKSFGQYSSSLNWIETEAKILKSESVKPKATSNHTVFIVEYEYSVDNKIYSGNRAVLWAMTNRDQAIAFEKQYMVDSEASVFYDPKNPREAVLVKGPPPDGKIYGGVIMSGVAMTLGFAISIAAFFGFFQ